MRAKITCIVILHRKDAKEFRKELHGWLMSHRMGLDHIDIKEEKTK